MTMKKLITAVATLAGVAVLAGADWRAFRGTDNTGIAANAKVPLRFSDKPGEENNVAWKIGLPGRGPSSPIVVGGKVVLTCSNGSHEDRLHVICFDTKDGRKLWHRQFWATGRTFCHSTTANAAPTPTSDGQLVFAFFSSNDLVCIDLDGNFQWYRGLAYDHPKTGNDVGMASSPVVVGDTVVVQIENQGNSFAAGIDKRTGQTRWRQKREPAANWSSPVVLRGAGPGKNDAVLLQSSSGVTALHPKSGKKLWTYEASCAGIPSSVAADDLVVVPADGLTVLRVPAEGKPVELAWRSRRLRPGTASPLIHAGRVYAVSGGGILACADARDGTELWKIRLTGPVWSTPILIEDYLYVISGSGLVQVVRPGTDQGEIVAKGDLGATIQATPAVADGAYYVRSDQHLWKIAAP